MVFGISITFSYLATVRVPGLRIQLIGCPISLCTVVSPSHSHLFLSARYVLTYNKTTSLHSDWNVSQNFSFRNVFDDTGSVINISLKYHITKSTKIRNQILQMLLYRIARAQHITYVMHTKRYYSPCFYKLLFIFLKPLVHSNDSQTSSLHKALPKKS